MKKIFASIYAVAIAMSSAFAEVITTEYFFDEDPGFGKGFKAGVTTNGTIKFKARVRNLNNGFHTLYVRGKNYDGWSHCVAIPVTMFEKSSEIVGSEYFFDKDPGEGKGKFVEVAADATAAVVINETDLSKLEPGFHELYSRALSSSNTWTSPFSTPYVYLPIVGPLKRAEFYIDKDPGEGNANAASVFGSNVGFQINTGSMREGEHTLYIRTQDPNGNWNIDYGFPFIYSYATGSAHWRDNVSLSPNPTMFNFDVNIDDKTGSRANVSIVSRSGKVVSEVVQQPTQSGKININVKDLAPGDYQVIVECAGETSVRRLVIKR